jgi:hypothetical protein
MLACPAVIAILAGVLAVGGWTLYSKFPPPSMSLDAWLNHNGPDLPGYPTAAAAFVENNIRPISGHLINEFPWGGYLAWRLHGRFQILVDGRTQLYPPQMWQSLYLGSAQERQAYLASLPADAAILPIRNSLFHDALIECGWTSQYSDDRAEVLRPPRR